VQVDNYQIVLVFDEAQEVLVRIYGIAFQVDFKYILNALQRCQLSHEIVFGQKSFDTMHILKVVQAFQLIV
jgi:hypothetical protein